MNEALNSGEAEFQALSEDVLAILRRKNGKTVLAIINRADYDFKYHIKGVAKGTIKACSAAIIEA